MMAVVVFASVLLFALLASGVDTKEYDRAEMLAYSGLTKEAYQAAVVKCTNMKKAHDSDATDCKNNRLGGIGIIDAKDGSHIRQKRKIIQVDKTDPASIQYWPTTIPYVIDADSSYTDFMRANFRKCIKHWEDRTCITFTYYDDSNVTQIDPNAQRILFVKGTTTSCISYVGMVPREYLSSAYQPIFMPHACANYVGRCIHEVGHALGLVHEHQRPDRDDTISITRKNILRNSRSSYSVDSHEFVLMEQTSYDIRSIMHYGPLDESKFPDSYTFTPHDMLFMQAAGQRVATTFWDVAPINMMYCADPNSICYDSTMTMVQGDCNNRGYKDPGNNCDCRCAEGFKGAACEFVDDGHNECTPLSGEILVTSSSWECVQSPGYRTNSYPKTTTSECSWLLTTGNTEDQIELQFQGAFGTQAKDENAYNGKGLTCLDWAEVKYKSMDFTLPGPRFCGRSVTQDVLTSNGNQVMITWASLLTSEELLAWGDSGDESLWIGFNLCYRLSTAPPVTTTTTAAPVTRTKRPKKG